MIAKNLHPSLIMEFHTLITIPAIKSTFKLFIFLCRINAKEKKQKPLKTHVVLESQNQLTSYI